MSSEPRLQCVIVSPVGTAQLCLEARGINRLGADILQSEGWSGCLDLEHVVLVDLIDRHDGGQVPPRQRRPERRYSVEGWGGHVDPEWV